MSNSQYGFRDHRSTVHALLNITNEIYSALDNVMLCSGVFLDLSKAFDTVDHDILLNKLQHFGFRGKPLQLIRSYLSCRKICVSEKDMLSPLYEITSGVPQGSVIGPLLFILYTNDFPNILNFGSANIFADDTALIFKDKSPCVLEKR